MSNLLFIYRKQIHFAYSHFELNSFVVVTVIVRLVFIHIFVLYLHGKNVFTQSILHEQLVTWRSIFKHSTAGLNSVFFLLDWLSNQG